MRSIIAKRTSIERIFESSSDLDTLIRASGGIIRDLFRLLRYAIDEAFDRLIQAADVERAVLLLRLNMLPVLFRADLPRLKRVLENPEDFDNSPESLGLLHRELVIPYSNGGVWFGVHPVIVERIK